MKRFRELSLGTWAALLGVISLLWMPFSALAPPLERVNDHWGIVAGNWYFGLGAGGVLASLMLTTVTVVLGSLGVRREQPDRLRALLGVALGMLSLVLLVLTVAPVFRPVPAVPDQAAISLALAPCDHDH